MHGYKDVLGKILHIRVISVNSGRYEESCSFTDAKETRMSEIIGVEILETGDIVEFTVY